MTRELQRTLLALAFCCILLGSGFVVLLRVSSQPENPIDALLRLPAPPPPNPEAQFYGRSRPPEFYKSSNPPPDNAPIADLLEYWRAISADGSRLRYSPEPSDRTASRLLDEVQKDPKKLTELLNVLPKDERTGNLVKELFERNSETGGYEKYEQTQIKRWLTYNTPHFSHELARSAQRSGADGESVRGEEELLALTRVDFSKAEPIVDRLYLDSGNRVGQVLGTWARYRHAVDTGSTGDVERYRDELKRFVEDRDASNRTRDLAMDALVLEKEWGGRDDWYYSLLGDPTLADLGGFTGLTTLILNSPDDKYIDKMLDLVKSDDPNVRSAAVRNLVLKIDSGRPEVIKALLPWLDDPKWAKDPGTVRVSLVRALRNVKVPESVPGLIKALDEKGRYPNSNATSANAAANAIPPSFEISSARKLNTNRATNAYSPEVEALPLRYDAVAALGTQEDIRAVPPLRRILNEPDSSAQTIIPALIKCKGFTVAEQVEGMDIAIRGREDAQARAEAASNAIAANVGYGWDSEYSLYGANSVFNRTGRGLTALEIKKMVGVQLIESTEASDDLAAAVVDHIEMLDKREPKIAAGVSRYCEAMAKFGNQSALASRPKARRGERRLDR